MTKENLLQYGITAEDFTEEKDSEGNVILDEKGRVINEYLTIDGEKYSFREVVEIRNLLRGDVGYFKLFFEIKLSDIQQQALEDYLTAQIHIWQTTRNHRGTHEQILPPKLSTEM